MASIGKGVAMELLMLWVETREQDRVVREENQHKEKRWRDQKWINKLRRDGRW